VELAANAEQDRAVRGLLREAVVERVLPFGCGRGLADQPRGLQRDKVRREIVAVLGDGAEYGFGEGTPDHRGELQRAPGSIVERVEPSGDQRLQRVGDRDHPVGLRPHLQDRGRDLLHEQRVALGPFEDLGAESLGRRQERIDQIAAVPLRQG
jgi:hypothetical protein